MRAPRSPCSGSPATARSAPGRWRPCPNGATTAGPATSTCSSRPRPPPIRAHVFYIEPPIDFCTNQKIATDVYYRWDGVHYGGLGAALVFKDITPQLLAIPRP